MWEMMRLDGRERTGTVDEKDNTHIFSDGSYDCIFRNGRVR